MGDAIRIVVLGGAGVGKSGMYDIDTERIQSPLFCMYSFPLSNVVVFFFFHCYSY